MQDSVIITSAKELQLFVENAVERALASVSHDSPKEAINERYLTFAEVRRELRCSAPTLRKVIKSGQLQGVRVGRQWRFRESDVHGLFNASQGDA